DVAQDVIVREEDCGTDKGLLVSALTEGSELIEPLIDRLEGRYSKETVRHPETNEILVRSNELITSDLAKEIVASGVEEMYIRSDSPATHATASANAATAKTWQQAKK